MITLVLSHDKVQDRVTRTASIIGRNAFSQNGVSLYENIRITEQELDTIHEYMDTADHELYALMRSKCTSYSYDSTTREVTYTFDYADDIEADTSTLTDQCYSFLSDSVLRSWLSHTYASQAEYYTSKINTDKANILMTLMNMASEPGRITNKDVSDLESITIVTE